MRYKKIILAGGSGYLGTLLANHLSKLAEEVVILSRQLKVDQGNITSIFWDGVTEGPWCGQLENADLLVNLCGKSVNCRYTPKNRSEILNSRIVPTRLLGKVINDLTQPPKLWINLSTATIYRHAEDFAQDEYTGEIGHGFSVNIAKAWENSFFKSYNLKTRKVALRMGIVLGMEDGAFPRLLNLVKFGLGGKQGSGKQYVNWVHEQDAIGCIEWLLSRENVNGIINCVSPNAVDNNTLMKTIRHAHGISFGMPIPAWLLKIGAQIIGTEPELILKSRWVKPAVLLENGFRFKQVEIEEAVSDILFTKLNH